MSNCYVSVKFSERGKIYDYIIPNHIDVKDVQKWVVVEDRYYKNNDEYTAPYKIAKVVCVKRFSSTATLPIAAAINSEKYIAERERALVIDDLYAEFYGAVTSERSNLNVEGLINAVSWLTYCPDNKVANFAQDYLEEKADKICQVM